MYFIGSNISQKLLQKLCEGFPKNPKIQTQKDADFKERTGWSAQVLNFIKKIKIVKLKKKCLTFLIFFNLNLKIFYIINF